LVRKASVHILRVAVRRKFRAYRDRRSDLDLAKLVSFEHACRQRLSLETAP